MSVDPRIKVAYIKFPTGNMLSLFLFSDGGAQEKQAPVTGNPAAVRSGFVQNAEAEIYYEQIGNRPPIVFAHGLGGNHLSWWQQVPYFSPHYACVTFAHRGFSPSRLTSAGTVDPALFEDDLPALVEHLKLAEVRLVAQSMGGSTCLNFALRYPGRVRALVMVSTRGAVDLKTLDGTARKAIEAWSAERGGMEAELLKRRIHPAAESGWHASSLRWNSYLEKLTV